MERIDETYAIPLERLRDRGENATELRSAYQSLKVSPRAPRAVRSRTASQDVRRRKLKQGIITSGRAVDQTDAAFVRIRTMLSCRCGASS